MTFAEGLAKVTREVKRKMIADGVAVDPSAQPPRFMYVWNDGAEKIVYANDAGTARSLIKKELGLRKKDRLPPGFTITRSDNPQRSKNKKKEEAAS